MFTYKLPEEVGISSGDVLGYINHLEEKRLSTHDVIIARGNNIIYEKYWAPFDKNTTHRLYSSSKSIVAIAVGFLIQEGRLSLDDTVGKFFGYDEKTNCIAAQTVRDLLMMSNAKQLRNWFSFRPDDRVKFYFENPREEVRDPGAIFEYASEGSFVLGAIVEELTGKPFLDYLREKLFDKIGVSDSIKCLRCPGGHSWGDSAVLCTPMDFLKIARFSLNYGAWEGEQILSRDYLLAATKKQIENNSLDAVGYNTFGYGYQFWRTYDDSFFFSGMGSQFAVCNPRTDLILIYNGDNQGNEFANEAIIKGFFDNIVRKADKCADKTPDESTVRALREEKRLICATGKKTAALQDKINGKTFVLRDNPMKIREFSLNFNDEKCSFKYINEQGAKELYFKMCENFFSLFPQEGYSAEVGSVRADGHYYKCACSGAWQDEKTLFLKVQIIDDYFGRLSITFGFVDEKHVTLQMRKTAEDFLNEYQGWASGTRK